jgi:hypothetical protein
MHVAMLLRPADICATVTTSNDDEVYSSLVTVLARES